MSVVTLDELKLYLRVDGSEEDTLIQSLGNTAENLCMDILRVENVEELQNLGAQGKTAVLYAVGYLFEHRDEADHHALIMTLRSLLSGARRECF